MTIKEYIRTSSKNTTLNGKDYDFNNIYELYVYFKKLGNKLNKEYNFNSIEILTDNSINDFSWPLLKINNNDSKIYTYYLTKEILDSFKVLEEGVTKSEICSIAILVSEISRILEFYNNYGKDSINHINLKVFEIINSINKNNPIVFQYDNINSFPCLFKKLEAKNPNINLMKEELKINDKNKNIVVHFNYLNTISIIMHFIKVEVMYYTSNLALNAKPPKKCKECHKIFIGKSVLCEDCARSKASARRNINKKCNTLRNKISKMKKMYEEILPDTILRKTEILLKEDHRYTQHKELEELYEKIFNYINKKS